jgi:predicted nucleic acid-binding protein
LKPPALIDTGPLVAFLNEREEYHAWAVEQVASLSPPLLTCEPVLSEACFLLRKLPRGSDKVLELVVRGLLTIPFRLQDEGAAVAKLLAKYADVPMSLADACLVRMAEQHGRCAVFTLDSDFRQYRKHGRQVIPTLMPEDL